LFGKETQSNACKLRQIKEDDRLGGDFLASKFDPGNLMDCFNWKKLDIEDISIIAIIPQVPS